MSLIQLIYVSSAVKKQSTAELDVILETSVRNNQKTNVTGMLLYADGSFLQVLEGEKAAVDEIFSCVEKDRRHHSIIVLERDIIQERSFENWSMGFRLIKGDDFLQKPASYISFFKQGFDPAKNGIRPGLALEILKDFAKGNRV
jgi:hypothetical protein